MAAPTDMVANVSATQSVLRLSNGHFAPGSGGRPRGARNRATIESIAAIRSLKDAAFIALASNIARGDQRAVEFVLDRILPTGRLVELSGDTPEDILASLIGGEISPDEARDLAAAIARLREIEGLNVMRDRLAQIEAILKEGDK